MIERSALAITLLCAVLLGFGVDWLGLPLGWMIGAMLATAGLSLTQFPVAQPKRLLDLVRTMIGAMLGAAFTSEFLTSIAFWWPSILLLTAALATMLVLGYVVLRRLFAFDQETAVLCAIPGGIAEIILLSERIGADQARVAILHSLRIALTVLLLPLLIFWAIDLTVPSDRFGASVEMNLRDAAFFALCIAAGLASARFLPIPAPLILVPMLVSAALHVTGVSDFKVPELATIAIQVLIGVNVGGRFAGVTLQDLRHAFAAAFTVVSIQIALAFGAAMAVASMLGLSEIGLILSYAPGGLAEMSLIAVAMGADPALVGVHHVYRVCLALIGAPLLVSAIRRDRS